LPAGIRLSVADVVRYGSGEQIDILLYNADILAQ